MKKLLAGAALLALLAGCQSPPATTATSSTAASTSAASAPAASPIVQTVQVDQAKIQSAIAGACGAATTAESAVNAAGLAQNNTVAAIELYVTASCGTANAVAALATKAVNDPSTIAWAQNLATELQAAVAQIKGAPVVAS